MGQIIKSYLTLVSVAMLGGMLSIGAYKMLEPEDAKPVVGFFEEGNTMKVRSVSSGGELPDLTGAAQVSTPAVVHIKSNLVVQARGGLFDDPFFDDFLSPFRQQRSRQAQASGSGVITSPEGYIVTNNHVVRDAQSVEVVLHDGRSYQAEVIGTDPSTDLAVLKIDEENLPFLPMGNSDNVLVGEWVLAVGNPFNLASTVTAGIVSAKARNIHILKDQTAIESFIQTDAAVNPGNSGGALVNSKGQLIGINTAIASPTGAYSGYSFAVPVEIVKKVIKDLMTHGIVQRAFLGVDMVGLNGEISRELGLEMSQGVYIDRTIEGGSAAEAGIQKGDVIVALDGKQLRNAAELTEYIGRKRPGDEVEATLVREGEEMTLPVNLRNHKGTTDLIRKQNTNIMESLGVELEGLSSKDLRQHNLKGGVRINRIGDGKIRQYTDIRPGFVITGLDNQRIESVEDLERILGNKQGGVMMEGVYLNRPGVYYYAFGM